MAAVTVFRFAVVRVGRVDGMARGVRVVRAAVLTGVTGVGGVGARPRLVSAVIESTTTVPTLVSPVMPALDVSVTNTPIDGRTAA